MGDVYGKESVVVDTHMIRIANRLGLVATKDPKQIEFALKKIIPPDMGSDFCHRIVLFGRDICRPAALSARGAPWQTVLAAA